MLALEADTTATIGRPAALATVTKWSATAANGTRSTLPLKRLPSNTTSPSASVLGPVAGTPSAAAISMLASAVSASGTGTACEPASRITASMSASVPPAPPLSSGTAISGRPISSISFQRSFGHTPFSTPLTTSLPERWAKKRSAVSSSMSRVSLST